MKEKITPASLPAVSKLLMLLVFSICFSVNAYCQTVTGKVTDGGGNGLPGISVLVKGSATGTTTSASGKYSIAVSSTGVLQFTSVGFKTLEVAVSGRSVIDVVLNTTVGNLNEVVVTALGIRKESRKLGYAASTVKVDEITQNRTTNVMKSLEGKIAGLDIAPPTAGAGASTRIRLRGQSGFSGQTNSPLIVINGLPMDQGARSAEGGGPTA